MEIPGPKSVNTEFTLGTSAGGLHSENFGAAAGPVPVRKVTRRIVSPLNNFNRVRIGRDDINATIGFDELSRLTRRPAKSLMRTLSPKGNPQARNIFEVIGHLQCAERVHFELSLRAAS
ncbi:MAG TPA: hypothetical protein VIK60_16585 [Vicinamibacterales bacterium]